MGDGVNEHILHEGSSSSLGKRDIETLDMQRERNSAYNVLPFPTISKWLSCPVQNSTSKKSCAIFSSVACDL